MIVLLIAAACSGDCRAQMLLQTMERKLLSAMPLQLEVVSHAEGTVKADATSEVSIGPATRLHTRGSYLGKPFARDFDEPTTPDLRDSLVLGMTRMGLLHNVLTLAERNDVDRSGVRDQVAAVIFKRVKGGLSYVLLVDKKEVGSATLLIDAKSKRPKKRVQVVHFPNGDMRVTETYRFPVVK